MRDGIILRDAAIAGDAMVVMDELISAASAQQMVADHMPTFGTESAPLGEASGRILRQDVFAERDQPPFDRVMMDGIAIRWRALLPPVFKTTGTQFAGKSGAVLHREDDCIEVMTGAMLPEGCDCVIPVERTDHADGSYRLRGGYVPQPGQFIHRQGSDCLEGARVLEAGMRIGPTEAALLAGNGVAQVEVAKVPAIAIIVTGDELVSAGSSLAPGEIRRSNDVALASALRLHGFDRISEYHVPDDEQALRETLRQAMDRHEALLLSGGVSMGQRDLVPATLQALGVRRVFHRIAQRPGKPMWFGVAPNGCVVFALPGNPASALVCAIRYARPALLRAMGLADTAPERVVLASDVPRSADLTCFIPVHLRQSADGLWLADAVDARNSGNFTSLAGTQGIIELPPGESVMPKGRPVPFYRW